MVIHPINQDLMSTTCMNIEVIATPWLSSTDRVQTQRDAVLRHLTVRRWRRSGLSPMRSGEKAKNLNTADAAFRSSDGSSTHGAHTMALQTCSASAPARSSTESVPGAEVSAVSGRWRERDRLQGYRHPEGLHPGKRQIGVGRVMGTKARYQRQHSPRQSGAPASLLFPYCDLRK